MTDENIEARTGTTEVKPTAGMPDWLLPDRVYDVLKGGADRAARHGHARAGARPRMGWTWADPAATTISAIALTIGVVIGASALKAKASKTE